MHSNVHGPLCTDHGLGPSMTSLWHAVQQCTVILWIYLISQLLSYIVLTPKHVHTSPFVYKPCRIEGQSSDCPFCALYELANFAPIIIHTDSPLLAIISLMFALVVIVITTLSFTTMEELTIAAILMWQFCFCAVMILYLQAIFLPFQ